MKTPHAPILLALLISAIALATASCGDPAASDDGGVTTPNPDARFEAARHRLGELKNTPWIGTILSIRQPLIDLHADLHDHLEGGVRRDDDLNARLDACTSLLDMLDAIDTVADRVWRAERRCRGVLAKLAVPEETPFPLRTRLEQGWLKDRGTHFGFLVTGLEALQRGEEEKKLAIAVGNLPRLAAEGEKLAAELEELSRPILVLDAKIKTVEQTAIPWAERVLRAAQDRTEVTDEERAALKQALDDARDALPGLKERWAALRPAAIKGGEQTVAEVGRLIREADAPQALMRKLGNPLAMRLRLSDR